MPEINSLLEQALKCHQGGDFYRAKDLYERVLSRAPEHPDALYLSGVLLQQLGEPREAIERLELALSFARGNCVILYNLAAIYFEQGLLEESIQTYEQVLEIEPHHISSLNNLGSIYFPLNPESSVKYFLKSYELDPSSLQALCNLSLALDLSLRKLEAFELLRQRFAFFSLSSEYCTTLSAILDGLDYELCTQDQREFLESLYGCEFINLDKLNQVLKPMFVCSLDDLSEVFSLKNLPSMIPRYLKASPISSDLEETRLLELRKLVTLGIQNDCQENQEELLALLEAIAIQEFRLEFSTFVSSEEREELKKFEGTSTLELLLRACYTKPSRAEIEQLSQTSYQDLYESYRKELEIQEMPISCFDLSNSTSKIVACHYEEDPYPKWCFVQKFNPIPFSQFLKERLGNRESVSSVANFPEILVAGCGTGKVLVELLSQVQYQNATGIDLSVQSLQYSKYRLEQANLQNVELLRSDLLSLKDLGQSYDFIDCCGVLHHLEYPREGLKTLVEVLRGGSYMRLALYSRIARRNITLVRQDYQSSVPDRESIIQARHELRNLEIENPRRYVLNYSDFYSVSGCRDLLFHSCEHQFDLPELKELLDSGGLIFCGFEFPSRRSLLEYSQCYPQDPYGLNLANWHTFELENPDFFAAMYQFYVRKNSTRKL